ncbi:hypothetical protein OE749_11330 [Aestuariibacter sp. AA17]|uniref:Membrane-associated protein n=1 Tax=Fluctibacter corallii TaxID=2984329 RepID=A0ABT3A9C4_9ALTE|nr:hypothetical protein [Aestuariibacter sp. AA17]MCV2885284.1 hypothetical protein [Aestuariibacter sp. AA17]
MKYYSSLPFTALMAISIIGLLVTFDLVPSGQTILEKLNESFQSYFYLIIFIIILLESIVYVGFYFPGQFFAVSLVVLNQPTFNDILLLTACMVSAATIGSAINYTLGRQFSDDKQSGEGRPSIKALLLAMIHMNSLAFFMFSQGSAKNRFSVVLLAGVLNLPYYLALIWLTSTFSHSIMEIAESTWLVFTLVAAWLVIALFLDWRKGRFTWNSVN